MRLMLQLAVTGANGTASRYTIEAVAQGSPNRAVLRWSVCRNPTLEEYGQFYNTDVRLDRAIRQESANRISFV